jgi:hypothetical protein
MIYAEAWKRATALKVNKMIGIQFWRVLASRVGRDHREQLWEADTVLRDREVRLLAMQIKRMTSWIASAEQEMDLFKRRKYRGQRTAVRPQPAALSSSLTRGALK